jgi:hypothetical protein
LPGEGVMVMKFNRTQPLPDSNCAAFASRLT